MNKFYISLAVVAILAVSLALALGRVSHSSRQSEYWHGKYDQSVSSQKRNDSIAGVYQMSLVALVDSTAKRAIEKETTSNVNATKINNRSNTKK